MISPSLFLFVSPFGQYPTNYDVHAGQDTTKSFRFVEMFAGQAEATRMFRFAQLPAARLDILYMEAQNARQNPMDLLSDAGMVTLGRMFNL